MKYSFIYISLLIALCLSTHGAEAQMALMKDGMVIYTDQARPDSITFSQQKAASIPTRQVCGVDLGLPSGTIWADRNVGAIATWDHGDAFYWSQVTPVEDITIWPDPPCELEYTEPELDAEHDAATVILGKNWQTPSREQWEELIQQCQIEEIIGVRWGEYVLGNPGVMLTGPNGNQLYLPVLVSQYVNYASRNLEKTEDGEYLNPNFYFRSEWKLQYSLGSDAIPFKGSIRAVRTNYDGDDGEILVTRDDIALSNTINAGCYPKESAEGDNTTTDEWGDKSTIDLARDVDYMTKDEKDYVLEVNMVRTNPQAYAVRYIAPILASKTSSEDYLKDVKECYDVLMATEAVGALAPAKMLYQCAKDHCDSQSKEGLASHTRVDGKSVGDAALEYGDYMSVGENIAGGQQSAREVVIALLIDKGIESRGHRINILNANYNYAGAAYSRAHMKYGTFWVMDFAKDWKDKE